MPKYTLKVADVSTRYVIVWNYGHIIIIHLQVQPWLSFQIIPIVHHVLMTYHVCLILIFACCKVKCLESFTAVWSHNKIHDQKMNIHGISSLCHWKKVGHLFKVIDWHWVRDILCLIACLIMSATLNRYSESHNVVVHICCVQGIVDYRHHLNICHGKTHSRNQPIRWILTVVSHHSNI